MPCASSCCTFHHWEKRSPPLTPPRNATQRAEATKQGLLARGWVENTDGSSPFFDLKWSVRAVDIDQGALLQGQVVNHFCMATQLTTKVGLMHCLENMRWHSDVDARAMFPRCYDLSSSEEMAAFEQVRCANINVLCVRSRILQRTLPKVPRVQSIGLPVPGHCVTKSANKGHEIYAPFSSETLRLHHVLLQDSRLTSALCIVQHAAAHPTPALLQSQALLAALQAVAEHAAVHMHLRDESDLAIASANGAAQAHTSSGRSSVLEPEHASSTPLSAVQWRLIEEHPLLRAERGSDFVPAAQAHSADCEAWRSVAPVPRKSVS